MTKQDWQKYFDDLINDPMVLTRGRRNNDTMNLMIASAALGYDWDYPIKINKLTGEKEDIYRQYATDRDSLRIRYVDYYKKSCTLEEKLIQ